MKFLSIIFYTTFLLLNLAVASSAETKSAETKVSNDSCVSELKDILAEDNADTAQDYRSNLNSVVRPNNEAEFLEGSNKEEAIILIHGFIASPHEVKSVAVALNEAGYSVYMPLLYGFGAFGEAANKGTLSVWREQIKNSVNKLSRCYKKITLGGLSLGGGLATDYVIHSKDPRISSVVLMSPFYDIVQSQAKGFSKPLAGFASSVPFSTIFAFYHAGDLTEILKKPDYYSDVLPLLAVNELFKLSTELKDTSAAKINTPIFVAYSEADATINLKAVVNLPTKHFKSVKFYSLSKSLNVPHQIAYAECNPKFGDMNGKIIEFIKNSNLNH